MMNEADEYVMRRSAELYPKLCERYAELKELTKEIIKYYVDTPLDFHDWHPVLQDAWHIVTEDREI